MPKINMLSLKITLDHTKPAVWRTIVVREDIPLTQLHDRIQGAMGWFDSHLHLFVIKGKEYVDYQIWDDEDGMADENRMTLKKAKLAVGDTFSYVYDMGDYWSHTVEVLERTSVLPEKAGSWVLDGANACPPEDVGGVHGYEEFIIAMANPNDEHHQQFRTWCGHDFDTTSFDVRPARRIVMMLDHFGPGYPWRTRRSWI
jgi:hypothetical protein